MSFLCLSALIFISVLELVIVGHIFEVPSDLCAQVGRLILRNVVIAQQKLGIGCLVVLAAWTEVTLLSQVAVLQ
jgi:hypothetical protein